MTSEFELVDQLRELFSVPEGVAVGIGDDAAVLEPGRFDLVTMDTLVEGVHFRTDWSEPEEIGWRALAANLSDVAAMGGGPGAFFLSLALPEPLDAQWVQRLCEGMKEAAAALVPQSFEVSAGGGDLSSSPGPAVISITLLGEASPAGPVLRRGAVPGDRIVVLGTPGQAEAGIAVLASAELAAEDFPRSVQAYQQPRPQVHAGGLLGLYGVPSAMIDTSDGLLQDLTHILQASRVGARVDSYQLRIPPELVELEEAGVGRALDWVLTGGEDFCLILTVPPARMPKLWDMARDRDWVVQDFGEIRAPEEGLQVLGLDGEPLELEKSGFRHFEES